VADLYEKLMPAHLLNLINPAHFLNVQMMSDVINFFKAGRDGNLLERTNQCGT